MDILSAGLTPHLPAPPTEDASSRSQASTRYHHNQPSNASSSTRFPSNPSSRFHTLPHPPSTTSSSLLKHHAPPPHFASHSSLPRNFMPQSNANHPGEGNGGVAHTFAPRNGPPPPCRPSMSASGASQFPLSSQSNDHSTYSQASINETVKGIENHNIIDSPVSTDNFQDSLPRDRLSFFVSRPPPTRGGTWPNSIPRGVNASDGAAGCLSGDSSLSRDSWTALGGGPSVQFEQQKPFDNPSMEKEYLNYIASVKQYLSNQQQHSADRNQSNAFGSNNNYSSKSVSYFALVAGNAACIELIFLLC